MSDFFKILYENSQWLFSGAFVSFILALLSILKYHLGKSKDKKDKKIIIEGKSLPNKIVINSSNDLKATIQGVPATNGKKKKKD